MRLGEWGLVVVGRVLGEELRGLLVKELWAYFGRYVLEGFISGVWLWWVGGEMCEQELCRG